MTNKFYNFKVFNRQHSIEINKFPYEMLWFYKKNYSSIGIIRQIKFYKYLISYGVVNVRNTN